MELIILWLWMNGAKFFLGDPTNFANLDKTVKINSSFQSKYENLIGVQSTMDFGECGGAAKLCDDLHFTRYSAIIYTKNKSHHLWYDSRSAKTNVTRVARVRASAPIFTQEPNRITYSMNLTQRHNCHMN